MQEGEEEREGIIIMRKRVRICGESESFILF